MGKYATTRAFQNDRKRTVDSSSNTFKGTIDYLDEVPRSESQFMLQNFLYNADPTGLYRAHLDNRDARNFWNDYFRNTGLSWSDVKYPTLMMHYGSITRGSMSRTAFNFVSSNVTRLYGR